MTAETSSPDALPTVGHVRHLAPGDLLLVVPEQLRQSDAAPNLLWTWLQEVSARGRGVRERREQLIEERAHGTPFSTRELERDLLTSEVYPGPHRETESSA